MGAFNEDKPSNSPFKKKCEIMWLTNIAMYTDKVNPLLP